MIFAVISDIHLGPEGYSDRGDLRKLAKHSKELVNDFVNTMNNKVHPSFVVQLGDVIEDDTPASDKKNYRDILELLSKLGCPLYNVVGNHDIKNLSEREIMELTGQDTLYYAFNGHGYHFITLFSKRDEGGNITVSEPQVQWLAQDLIKTDLGVIVFIHHSLADQDLTGNYWFEGLPQHCLITNRQIIRKILENSGQVKAVINGHLHWNRMHIHNKIPYFNFQSLVENFRDNNIPSASYAIVELDDKQIKVKVVGNDPAHYLFSYSLNT